uniref:Uncharacterized protein n=1 Tax=Glossina austeni TaxID=7395 RepID=A0A1A9VPL2_GLOAU
MYIPESKNKVDELGTLFVLSGNVFVPNLTLLLGGTETYSRDYFNCPNYYEPFSTLIAASRLSSKKEKLLIAVYTLKVVWIKVLFWNFWFFEDCLSFELGVMTNCCYFVIVQQCSIIFS